jgi:DNA-directed RNA polymerase specialized sigma24 family protein
MGTDKILRRKKFGFKKRRRYQRFWSHVFCVAQRKQMLAYAATLTNGDLCYAEDLVQTAFYRILKYLPPPAGIRNRLNFIRRTLYRAWINSRQAHTISLDELAETEPNHLALVVNHDILQHLDNKELAALIRELPVGQPPKFDLMLQLFGDGCSWREIAAALDEKESTIKFRWYSHLRNIRRELKRRGFDL